MLASHTLICTDIQVSRSKVKVKSYVGLLNLVHWITPEPIALEASNLEGT